MKNEKQLFDILAKIGKLASAAAKYSADDSDEESTTEPSVSCSIKQLPERLRIKAAETAARINPVNSPSLDSLGSLSEVAAAVSDPQFLTLLTAKYWGPAPRKLTVSFMEPTPADLRARLLSHLNAWSKTGGISFVQTAGTGQVRISRGAGGYWSYLGTDVLLIPASKPTMNLQGFSMNTPESEYRRVVRHEAGHTLGFPHEHMRAELVARIDPAKAYAYFLQTQGWNKATVDAQVLTPLKANQIKGTAADQTSIMCYQLPGSITKDGQPILGGKDINATDYAFVARIYPKSGQQLTQQAHQHEPAPTDDWDEAEDVPEEAIASAEQASLAPYPNVEDEETDLYSNSNGVASAV